MKRLQKEIGEQSRTTLVYARMVRDFLVKQKVGRMLNQVFLIKEIKVANVDKWRVIFH
ncbi:hypothetical protein Sgly_0698 [Syntrophobotulus glycolicus DSM 8271]|uniref:Uncharacterized protein n=1 Tax=Syntrophobotulus glycolicus (strain DSM 8271 / FlGlyR) TaxID=645991 RepID=F0T0J5_SYNGF|nr:hypothetical protein Sgly_0698 [Syntrophobotulus glycolicus DSM 8271]